MKHNNPGESSREEYENVERQRDEALTHMENLHAQRNAVEAEHSALRAEFAEEEPGTPYPLAPEEAEALSRIDDELTPFEATLKSTEKHLERLYGKAWDEAHEEKDIREITSDIKKELLPEIKKECSVIHDQWEKLEQRGHWLVRRADAIEKEIEEILNNKFSAVEAMRTADLIKEFWEVRKQIGEMHQRALGWNIREKKD